MKNAPILQYRKILGIVFTVLIFLFVVACSSTRKSPNGSYKKKKDCGCGSWTTLPDSNTAFAQFSYKETTN